LNDAHGGRINSAARVSKIEIQAACRSFLDNHIIGSIVNVMKQSAHPSDGPGQQWFWKITLTALCAMVGAIIALHWFRAL
jgi:hypothetical protein